MKGAAIGALALAMALPCARGAAAQENPAIRDAVRLAAEGRGDEARRAVQEEYARARPGDPAYVEALFWRARLTLWGDSAERDLRRVAIEFPASRWADDALLHLAQMALTAGNPVSAVALAARLRGDYPESDLRPRAALWAARAAFDLGDAAAACSLLDSARTEAPADVEFGNQVAFYRGRCQMAAPEQAQAPTTPRVAPTTPDTSRTAVPAPTAARPARDSAVAAPPTAPRSGWSVQVAALRTDAEARRVLQTLRRAGFEGHSVEGGGLRRVRVGPFPTQAEAQRARDALQPVVGGRPFLVREP